MRLPDFSRPLFIHSRHPRLVLAGVLALLPVLTLLPGCRGDSTAPAADHPAAPAATRYPFTGRVVAVVPEHNALLIAHEDVVGLMPAMTMEFPVDAAALHAAAKDARLTAELVVEGGAMRLEHVKFSPPSAP